MGGNGDQVLNGIKMPRRAPQRNQTRVRLDMLATDTKPAPAMGALGNCGGLTATAGNRSAAVEVCERVADVGERVPAIQSHAAEA